MRFLSLRLRRSIRVRQVKISVTWEKVLQPGGETVHDQWPVTYYGEEGREKWVERTERNSHPSAPLSHVLRTRPFTSLPRSAHFHLAHQQAVDTLSLSWQLCVWNSPDLYFYGMVSYTANWYGFSIHNEVCQDVTTNFQVPEPKWFSEGSYVHRVIWNGSECLCLLKIQQ